VSRHLAPVALVVFAGLADSAGRSDLAFYALLTAVPIVAASALGAYGDLVTREAPAPASVSLQALLWGLAVVLVTASAGVRAPAFDSVAPTFGVATLTACLAVSAVQLTLAAAGELKSK
jgi:predicted RNA-binding Zn ribbon-like protein